MADRSLSLAFVMDPVEAEDFKASTTIALMAEAQRRGHEVLYIDPGDLRVAEGETVARVTPVSRAMLAPEDGPWHARKAASLSASWR